MTKDLKGNPFSPMIFLIGTKLFFCSTFGTFITKISVTSAIEAFKHARMSGHDTQLRLLILQHDEDWVFYRKWINNSKLS